MIMDYVKAAYYFIPPEKAIFPIHYFAIGGVLLFFMLFGLISGAIGLAVILLLLGGGFIYLGVTSVRTAKKKNEARGDEIVTDEAYDSLVQEYAKELVKTRALDVLGIDASEVQEINPITFGGYKYLGATLVKQGDDRTYRSNLYEAVTIFFSANELHCYRCEFLTTKNKITESTEVFFYRDVVSVSTRQEPEKVQNKDVEMQKFVLTTTGGTAFSVSLHDVEDAQRSVNAMRNLLREKKAGMA